MGSWVAVVTPLTADDRVDIDGLARLVDFHVDNGSDGLMFLAPQARSTSCHSMRRKIIAAMAPACKDRIPVFLVARRLQKPLLNWHSIQRAKALME